MFYGKQITEQEEPAIRKFVLFFYNAVFKEYCQGERGILRSRINQFKDGSEAYYMHLVHKQRIQDQEDEVASEVIPV